MEYFVFLIFLIFLNHFISRHNDKYVSFIVVCGYLVFLYSIRTESVGNVDIPRYVSIYDDMSNMQLKDVFVNYKKDILFYIVCWLLNHLTDSYNFLFFAVGVTFISSVAYLIKDISRYYLISFLIFISFFLSLNFSLLRHCVAFSMVILAYISLKKKYIKIYFLCIILAFFFQGTSIVALLLYPIKKIKFRIWYLLLFPVGMMLSNLSTLNTFLTLLDEERYMSYLDYDFKLNYTYIIIYATLMVYVLFLIRNKYQEYVVKYCLELNMMVVGLSFMGMSIVIAEAHRLAMFFFFVVITLIPNLIKQSCNVMDRIVSVVFIVFLVYYFLHVSIVGAGLIPFNTII